MHQSHATLLYFVYHAQIKQIDNLNNTLVSNIQIYPIIIYLWILDILSSCQTGNTRESQGRLSRCCRLLGLQLCCSLQHFIGAVLDGDSKLCLIACQHCCVSCLIWGRKTHSRNCTYEIMCLYTNIYIYIHTIHNYIGFLDH